MTAMGIGYDMGYAAAVVLASPVWGCRMLRRGKWRTDWPARLGRCAPVTPDGRAVVLLHAVSVGEVNAIQKLVETLDQRARGALRLVISVTTDTGIARAKQLFEPRHSVVRFPLDFGRCVGRFLDAVKPDLVALTELEVWPNFVGQCQRRGVPVCVINGRLSARSHRWYRAVAALVRPAFSRLTVVAAQTQQYAQRFAGLGVPADRVRVLDSMKWDAAAPGVEGALRSRGENVPGAMELARAMGIDLARPIVVAGSTGPGEEKMLIETCPTDAQLVLVPRKPERFEEVAGLVPGIVRRSRCPDGSEAPGGAARVFLVDTMGELLKAYDLADVAVVGRSFLGLYGSNPMEPVALGRPTVIGPFHSDFSEIVETLAAGGGIAVTDQPGRAVAELLSDRAKAGDLATRGRSIILSRRGATDRHAEMLLGLLPARFRTTPASVEDQSARRTHHSHHAARAGR